LKTKGEYNITAEGNITTNEVSNITSPKAKYHFFCFYGIILLVQQIKNNNESKFLLKLVVFSYIRLRRVILLRSDIRLKPSDIALLAVLEANIISLKPQVSISLSRSENITPTKSEYH